MSVVLFGLDSTSGVSPTAHRAVGSKFANRYLSRYTSKVITRAEYATNNAAGIYTGLVFEDGARNAWMGFAQGKSDAEFAKNQAYQILGAPMGPDAAIWFAVDNDTAGNPGATDSYFDGVASVIPKTNCGPYGSYEMVMHAWSRGFRGIWQCYAWSRGQFFQQSQVYQYSNDHIVGGVGTDFNKAFTETCFWNYHPKATPPADPHGYHRFMNVDFPSKWGMLNERRVVEEYDGARLHPVKYRNYLKKLEDQCLFLAGRIAQVAERRDAPEPAGFGFGNPTAAIHEWHLYDREWRFHQLVTRAKGEQVVK